MINNARIREMIEDPEKTKLISNAIETSARATGMQTFDQSLLKLIKDDLITLKEALRLCNHPDDFYLKYSGISPGQVSHTQVHTQIAEDRQMGGLPSFPDFDLEEDDE